MPPATAGRGARADTTTPVALGFSGHTGWAVAITAAGKPLGRPWGKDERDALLVAAVALAAARAGTPGARAARRPR